MQHHTRRAPQPVSPRVVVIGGDERTQSLADVAERVRTFPSRRSGGAGSPRRALATIAAGSIDLVVVLCRWVGHSDYHAIVACCRAAGVPILRVRGGFSAARRAIADALEAA